MVYRNLECDNEKTYRWHDVNDIKDPKDAILQSVIKDVKEDIGNILRQIEDVNVEEVMEKYIPSFIGIQTIYCPSCRHLQIDVIVNDQTKIREDLWRSYEADRFVRQFMRGS